MDDTTQAIAYYADRPVEFVEDIIGATPDDIQADILNDVAKYQMTTVRSGHGIGKSAVASWLVIWFMLTRPFPKVVCTAPTMHQLNDILWAEISKWIRNNPSLREVLVWTKERVYMVDHPEEWFAAARTASTPDALQGFHADNLLFLIDEASGVADIIFEPVLGALSTENATLAMFGNPTQLKGFFYDSHHKNRSLYRVHHVDGRTSARVDKLFVQRIIDMYGEDSDVFRVRVSGDFPKALPDSFIPMDWCERASRVKPEALEPRRIDIGVDVARFGDDDSVICSVLDRMVELEPSIHHHNDTMQLSGLTIAEVKRMALEYPTVNTIHVKIDCDGLGVGVFDRVNEQRKEIEADINNRRDQLEIEAPFSFEVFECHFGAEGGTISDDDPIEFANSTGLMWGAIRQALLDETLALWYSDRQISQLSNRKYSINSAGKIELERKEHMKARGVSSPDIGDALGLALYNPVRSDWGINT